MLNLVLGINKEQESAKGNSREVTINSSRGL